MFARILLRRHLRAPDRLERPPRTLLFGELVLGAERLRFGTEGGRSGENPGLDRGDVLVGEFRLALRHLPFLQHFEEVALGRFSRDEGGSGLAAFREKTCQAHIELPFFLPVLTMAMKAMRLENGAHVLFKNGSGPDGTRRGDGKDCRNPQGSQRCGAELHGREVKFLCLNLQETRRAG